MYEYLQQFHFKLLLRCTISKTELGNDDLLQLFGTISSATISRLKGKARDKMIEKGVASWNANRVNTAAAYESWGLDINDLEYRYRKLQELSLANG